MRWPWIEALPAQIDHWIRDLITIASRNVSHINRTQARAVEIESRCGTRRPPARTWDSCRGALGPHFCTSHVHRHTTRGQGTANQATYPKPQTTYSPWTKLVSRSPPELISPVIVRGDTASQVWVCIRAICGGDWSGNMRSIACSAYTASLMFTV